MNKEARQIRFASNIVHRQSSQDYHIKEEPPYAKSSAATTFQQPHTVVTYQRQESRISAASSISKNSVTKNSTSKNSFSKRLSSPKVVQSLTQKKAARPPRRDPNR